MEIIIETRRFVVGPVSQNGKERVIKRIKYTIDIRYIMKELLNVTRTEEYEVLYDGVDWKLYEDDKGVLRLEDMMNDSYVLIDGDDMHELSLIKSIIKGKYKDRLKYI